MPPRISLPDPSSPGASRFCGPILLALLAALSVAASAAKAVTIEWVAVAGDGAPNACDPQSQGCFGAVAETYRIGKYEVTNAQYAEFLNAVAGADPNGLYSTNTSSFRGIARTGSPGSYHYSAIAGRESMPVNFVSFYDGLRFANWLHNGQPVGSQGSATTEDGAYTITQAGIDANSITRNAGARVFLPSEDEWYKAAYYDVASRVYFDSPTGTDLLVGCAPPGAGANISNCNLAAGGDLTDVGSYPGSPSPNGTFDQAGNVYEWTEAIVRDSDRIARGGAFLFPSIASSSLQATPRPTDEASYLGFRLASVPEPGAGACLALGALWAALRAENRRARSHRGYQRERDSSAKP